MSELDEEKSFEFNEEEYACKLVDALICMLCANNESNFTLFIVKEGMRIIAQARQKNPDFPITIWLENKMCEKGWLPRE